MGARNGARVTRRVPVMTNHAHHATPPSRVPSASSTRNALLWSAMSIIRAHMARCSLGRSCPKTKCTVSQNMTAATHRHMLSMTCVCARGRRGHVQTCVSAAAVGMARPFRRRRAHQNGKGLCLYDARSDEEPLGAADRVLVFDDGGDVRDGSDGRGRRRRHVRRPRRPRRPRHDFGHARERLVAHRCVSASGKARRATNADRAPSA